MTENKKSQMKILLMALTVVLPTNNLSAEEVRLRCDQQRAFDVVLLSIDTSHNTVHWGEDPNSGWFSNNDKYTASDKDVHPCEVSWTQFVNISPGKIEFGATGVNINNCGFKPYAPGEIKLKDSFIIDRTTGIFTADLAGSLYSASYQCQKLTGKAF